VGISPTVFCGKKNTGVHVYIYMCSPYCNTKGNTKCRIKQVLFVGDKSMQRDFKVKTMLYGMI
jgi:hypothetical protein